MAHSHMQPDATTNIFIVAFARNAKRHSQRDQSGRVAVLFVVELTAPTQIGTVFASPPRSSTRHRCRVSIGLMQML